MTEVTSPIPARLKNVAKDGHVCGASDVDFSELPVSDGTDVEAGELYINSLSGVLTMKLDSPSPHNP